MLLNRMKTNPGPTALVLAALAVLLVWGLSRTTWRPGGPRRSRAGARGGS